MAIKGAVDDDDILYIYDEWYRSQMLLSVHAEKMMDMRYAGDPSGKREIEELLDLGVRVSSGDNDVNLGLQKVNERIKSHRIKVFKNCKNLIDEFETYHWEGEKDKPHKEDDHCMDALRYLVMELDKDKLSSSWTWHRGMEKEEEKARKEAERAKKGDGGKSEDVRDDESEEPKKPKDIGRPTHQGGEEKKEKPKRESDDDSWVV